ncbi:MAG: hypothetical protein AAGA56_21255 [Myxococcota bacterium]
MNEKIHVLFTEALANRGIAYTRRDAWEYEVTRGEWAVVVNVENVHRELARGGAPELLEHFVEQIVEQIVAAAQETELPWPEAKAHLLWSVESGDHDLDGVVTREVSPMAAQVLTLTNRDHTRLTWVTRQMCDQWGVDPRRAAAVATANQDRLLENIALEVGEAEGEALGMIPLESAFKASVIFAPRLRQWVESDLGWPVLAVVPCRDFIYLLPHDSPLVPHLGGVVVREYRGSGYPVSTEVFRISDDGVKALGNYGAAAHQARQKVDD